MFGGIAAASGFLVIAFVLFFVVRKKKAQKQSDESNNGRYCLVWILNGWIMRWFILGNVIWFLTKFCHHTISDANDHAGYDGVEFPNDGSNIDDLTALNSIQNPYYGGEIETNEPESVIASKAKRNSLRENIKITDNPYYE